MTRFANHSPPPRRRSDGNFEVPVFDHGRTVFAVVDRDGLEALRSISPGGLALSLDHARAGFYYVRTGAYSARRKRWERCCASRIIVGAGSGQCVKLLDGDPLNLLRSNLLLCDGPSKTAALVATAETRAQVVSPDVV